MASTEKCPNTWNNFNHPTPGSGRAKNETMTKEQIMNEVKHVFEAEVVNEIRIFNLIQKFVRLSEKETRHIAAEIAGTAESPDQAHQQIMNISILKQWS